MNKTLQSIVNREDEYIMSIPEIRFGKMIYCEDEGGKNIVYSYRDVEASEFDGYISELESAGFAVVSKNVAGLDNKSVNLSGNDCTVYAMYYPTICEMRIVCDPESDYLHFEDVSKEAFVTSLITQIELEDYGQSSVVRLSDGRFIIFDGGWDFEPDADKLMNCLCEQSPYETPIVAAWIMTHPDVDHYRCCISFTEKYADKVVVENFIYNFPDAVEENTERVPHLTRWDNLNKINELNRCVERLGARLFRAHTGQVYNFANAKLEILSSPDDCFAVPVFCFNDVSLVIKMTIENQTILWSGDANFEIAKLAQRWGNYLKSDILQIPHHGFAGGRKKEYALIDPSVCLLTGDEEVYFALFCIYRPENSYLINELNVKDWYMNGNGTYTLTLPYTPRANGRKLLFDKVEFNRRMSGAQSWFFDGVTDSDCNFVFINTNAPTATVYADLYFDDANDFVRHIKIEVENGKRSCVNLLNESDVDADALYCNSNSLKKKGVPVGKTFTVHFKSDVPVVIIGKTAPAYCF